MERAISRLAGVAVANVPRPCALGVANPTAIVVGTGKGAEYGVLIPSGAALEHAHQIDAIVLDKTGTITAGAPPGNRYDPLNGDTQTPLNALGPNRFTPTLKQQQNGLFKKNRPFFVC